MQPIDLRVENACQFVDATLVFEKGVTIVIGQNRGGKTNLTRYLHFFAMTGKTLDGRSKKRMVNRRSKQGKTVYRFMFSGRKHVLTRHLHNSDVILEVETDSEPTVYKKGDAESYLNELQVFGSPEVLEITRFTQQQRLTDILTMRHSDRVALLIKTFGLTKFDVIREKLLAQANKLPTYISREAKKAELLERANRVDEYLANIDEHLPSIKEDVDKYTAHKDSMETIMGLPVASSIVDKIAAATKELEGIKDVDYGVPPEEVPQPIDRTAVASRHSSFKVVEGDYLAARSYHEAGMTTFSAMADPVYTDDQINEAVSSLDAANATISADIVRARGLQGKASCPTCGQAICEEFNIEEGEATVAANYATKNAYVEHRNYNRSYHEASRKSEESSQRLQKLEEKYNSYTQEEREYDPTISAEEFRRYNEYATAVTEYNRKVALFTSNNERKVALQGHIETLKNTETRPDHTSVEFRETVDSLREAEKSYSDNVLDKKNFLTELDLIQSTIDEIHEESIKSRDTEEAKKFISNVREMAHRDNIPTNALQHKRRILNTLMADYLSKFNRSFTAELNEDFDFVCKDDCGDDCPVSELSGGEKVTLAISYMLAQAEITESPVPVIVLDEPTDALDDKTKAELLTIFDSLQAFSDRGMTILVPTHDPMMEEIKANIIKVDDYITG